MERRNQIVLIRIAIVVLLASLAGFTTIAKNSQYLPKSNPARYLSIASKMKADRSAVTVEPPPVMPCAIELAPPARQTPVFWNRIDEREEQPAESIGISVSVRRRPPPVSIL